MKEPANNLSYLAMNFAYNPLVHTVAPAAATDIATIRHFAKLRIPDSWQSANFKTVSNLEAAEEPSLVVGQSEVRQGALFYLDSTLKSILKRSSQVPEFGQIGMLVCPGMVTPYNLETRATEGIDTPVGTPQVTPVAYALKGGINVEDFAEWGNSFFTSYLYITKQFLTWQPNNKVTDRESPEYLYFLQNFTPTPTSLSLYVDVTYENGDFETILKGQILDVKQYEVYCCSVGFKALEIIETDQKVKKWEVYIVNSNDKRVSEVRTYYIDLNAYRSVEYILFQNSLGAFETMRFTGQAIQNLQTERERSVRSMPADYTRSFASSFNSFVSNVPSLTVSTGYYLDQAKIWTHYFQEIFFSDEIYQVTERGYRALVLDTKELTYFNSSDNMIPARLKFLFANSEERYSRMPKLTPVVIRETAWRGKEDDFYCQEVYGSEEPEEPAPTANWVDTGNVRCKEAAPRTTTMAEKEQKDNNPLTNLGTRWVDDQLNPSVCPLPEPPKKATVKWRIQDQVRDYFVQVISNNLGILAQENTVYSVADDSTVTVNVLKKVYVRKNGIINLPVQVGPLTFALDAENNYEIVIGTSLNPRN